MAIDVCVLSTELRSVRAYAAFHIGRMVRIGTVLIKTGIQAVVQDGGLPLCCCCCY